MYRFNFQPHAVVVSFLSVMLISGVTKADKPETVIKKSHEKINKLLRKEKQGKATKGSLDNEMKKVINRFLDFEGLAQASMSKHWDKLQPDQKKSYTEVFRELIETNYIRRLRGDLNYKVVYGKTNHSGDKATVNTTIERLKRGRKDETKITYRLRKKGGRWQVYDVVTNNVSLANNYRRSFGRIMRREGFDSLLKKMKRKIEKLR